MYMGSSRFCYSTFSLGAGNLSETLPRLLQDDRRYQSSLNLHEESWRNELIDRVTHVEAHC